MSTQREQFHLARARMHLAAGDKPHALRHLRKCSAFGFTDEQWAFINRHAKCDETLASGKPEKKSSLWKKAKSVSKAEVSTKACNDQNSEWRNALWCFTDRIVEATNGDPNLESSEVQERMKECMTNGPKMPTPRWEPPGHIEKLPIEWPKAKKEKREHGPFAGNVANKIASKLGLSHQPATSGRRGL
jgi:hypothetical protein